jgi:very-short-patch-repair endonuclease
MSELDRRIAERAVRQHGLITLTDIIELGGSRQHVARRLSGGRLTRMGTETFLISGAPATNPVRMLAALLDVAPRALQERHPGVASAACSHLAAGRLHDIPGYGTAPPEVAVPRGQRRRRAGVRVHESTDLDRCDVVLVDGIPVTDVHRTLLDLARYVGPQRLLRNIEWCRRQGLTTWSDLIATLARHARQGRHGIRRLRRVILAHADQAEVTDSDLELVVLSLLREHGLPDPVLHHRVEHQGRFVAEVDLAYPGAKVAIECDGDVHLEVEVREADLPRQNDLVLLGWTVLRFSWRRVRDRPAAVVAEVSNALRRVERSPAA